MRVLKRISLALLLLLFGFLGGFAACYWLFPRTIEISTESPVSQPTQLFSQPLKPAPAPEPVALAPTLVAQPINFQKSVQIKRGKMLLLQSDEFDLLVDFTAIGTPEHGAESAKYRWRYRSAGGAEQSGSGTVFEKYETVVQTAKGREVRDAGGQLGITAGPILMTWSHGGTNSAWIYFPPQALRYRVLDNATYDKFGIGPNPNVPEF